MIESIVHYAKDGNSRHTGCGVRITHDTYATRILERINCEECLKSTQYLEALAQSMEEAIVPE